MDGCLSLFITFFSANVTDLHLKELSFVTESQSPFLRFKCIFSQLTSARWKRCQNPSWNPIVHVKAHLFCYHSVFDSSDFLITWLFLNSYLFVATLITTQEIFSSLPIMMQGKMQETLSCSWSVWTAYIISFLKIKFLNLERHLREEVTCFSTSSNVKDFLFPYTVFSC